MKFHRPVVPNRPLTVGVYLVSDALTDRRKVRVGDGCEVLRRSGYQVTMPRNIDDSDGFAAGSARVRQDAIYELADDDRIHLLMSGWGGKAAIDLFQPPRIDAVRLARHRKAWFGFSDACVLMNAITFETGLITFYGPNVVGKLDESSHSALEVDRYSTGWWIFGKESEMQWWSLLPGRATGRLMGGNLTTFAQAYLSLAVTSCATRNDTIFFFESANEDPRVQRQMLVALDVHNFFRHVAAVVVGHIAGDAAGVQYVVQTVYDICERMNTPLFMCPTFGHADLENPPIPLGVEVIVDPASAPIAPYPLIIREQ